LNLLSIHSVSRAFSLHTLLGIPRTPVEGSFKTRQLAIVFFDSVNIRRAINSVETRMKPTVSKPIAGSNIQSRRGSALSLLPPALSIVVS
jgi:hypothetical protein